jgi:hypothetical protein
MALKKQLVEIPFAKGLQQKFAPQRLPVGYSAKAQNLVVNKSGRGEKRLGFFPLQGTDPFQSGYSINQGVALGTWDSNGTDSLLIAGRGVRPSSGGALATSLQNYSDDLGGPTLRGQLPDLGFVSDLVSSGSPGATFNVCQAVYGDILVQAWLDTSFNTRPTPLAQARQPLSQVGILIWSATSISTGQQIVGPSLLDGRDIQFVRLAVVVSTTSGPTFVIAYTATSSANLPSPGTNGYIYCRTLRESDLVIGGTWSGITNLTTTNAAMPNPYGKAAPPLVSYTGTSAGYPAGAFDMRAVIGDATSFILAYESGTWVPPGETGSPGYWTNGSVLVQRWAVGPPPTLTTTWTVNTYSGVNLVCGFGVRADFNLQKVAVAWSLAGDGSSTQYTVQSAVASYPLLIALSTVTTLYTADTPFECPPFWLDMSYADGGWVTAHSPMGSCWNAAYSTSQAVGSQGSSAAASAVVGGSMFEIQIDSYGNNGLFNSTPAIQFNGGGGSGAAGTFAMTGSGGTQSVASSIVSTAGGGYSYPNSLTAICTSNVSSGFNEPPVVTPILLYTVTGASVTDGGANYTAVPAVTFDQGGAGVGAVIGITYGGFAGGISSISILNPGYGYTSSPSCTVIDPTGVGSGGAISLTASAGTITGKSLVSQGAGYVLPSAPGNASGIHGVFSAAVGNFANFTDASTTFTAADVGSYITTAGGSDSTNRGSFIVAALISTHVVSVINPSAVANTGANLTWTEFYNGAKVSGGAVATASLDTFGNQTVASIAINNGGQYYPTPPNITLTVANNLVGLQQDQTHRLGFPNVGSGSALVQCWYPENNARIIQNQFSIAGSTGLPLVSFQDGVTAIGAGSISCCGTTSGGTGACLTPGVTLASCGMEANGIIYYLGWIPSLTQGGFVVLAFDRACNKTATVVGNNWPMRPVGNLQTRTALADPGWGFQPGPGSGQIQFPSTWVYQSPSAPNCWTGGSFWYQQGDAYGSCVVSYVSASQGGRLSPAYGRLQTAPTQSYPMVPYGNVTAIGGALPSIYDGQNVIEQGFLYTPESILVTPVQVSTGTPLPGNLTWSLPTDAYNWIFTWEHFDAQGNFHISARAPITVTGQDILDVWGPGAIGSVSDITHETTFTLPFTGALLFTIPSLGVTMRSNFQGDGLGNDLRAFCAGPSDPVILGGYRTELNGLVYFRLGDRFFNGDDIGDTNFSLSPPVQNAQNGGTVVTLADGLPDNVLNGTQAAYPFPQLYGDGTNGAPGSLDNYCPPASNVMTSDTDRLYVARGNQLLWTKVRSEGLAPAYNEQVNAVTVANDDPIVNVALMDGNVVIVKGGDNWYLSGSGPNDSGAGQFSGPTYIPTDVGCISRQSVISTPEGIYYQSTAGLRLIDRGLVVKYIGGPVEDELATYPTILGASLYPQNNRLILLASQGDTPVSGDQLTGELVVRDYFLDAWTTGLVMNGAVQTGFISAVVAQGTGEFLGPFFRNGATAPTLHLLGADGTVWREHKPNDDGAYYDNDTYVSSYWTCAPIQSPEGVTQGRFRLWDILAFMQSQDPHGLIISVGVDYGTLGQNRTWVWNSATGAPSIAPGGTIPTPLTQLRTYDGRMGESFVIQIQDVSDTASVTGQGSQVLGLTVALGVAPGPYKLPASATQ